MRTSAQRSTQQRSEADYEAAWAKLAQVTGTQARRATLLALALAPLPRADNPTFILTLDLTPVPATLRSF